MEIRKATGVGWVRRPQEALDGRSAERRRASLGARRAGLAVSLVSTLALVSAPAVASAADDCPNAAVRAQQVHASSLPNCMAYERVTPNDKKGSYVRADSPVSVDGASVSVWATTQMLDDDTAGLQQLGAAHRGSDGWAVQILSNSPDWGKAQVSMTLDVAWWQAISEDFRTLLYRTNHPLAPGDRGGAIGFSNSPDLYLSRPDGPHVWVTAPVSGSVPAGAAQAGTTPRFWRGSLDLSRVVFDTSRILDPAVDGTVRSHLWLYQDGGPLEVVDRLPDGDVSTGTEALSGSAGDNTAALRVSRDARRIVFLSSSLHGRSHIYARVDAGTSQARTVLVSASSAGTPCPVNPAFGHITESGRYVRFTCAAQLTPDAPASGGAYVRDLDSGSVTFDEPQADRGSPPVRNRVTSYDWTRPEGTYRVRGATVAEVGTNVGGTQIALEDLTTNTARCVSCPTDGSVPTGASTHGGGSTGISGGAGITAYGAVTPDGEVVFQTAQRLVPADTNSAVDVYMWKDGKHYLLSSGTTGGDVQLGGTSLDGSTVTMSTAASLVPEDRDGGARDIYVVRRDGGFLRSGTAEECTSGCQGAAQPPAPLIRPLTLDFAGGAQVEDDGIDPIAVSGSRSVRGTSLKIKVRTPGAGRVTASGNGLRKASRSVKSATSATVTVKLSARSQRLLRKRSSLKATATVRFVPAEGTSQSKRVSLTFRKAKAKKKASSRKAASKARTSAAARKGAR